MTAWQPGPRSRELMERAQQRIPGGVNSPVRAFNAVGLSPFFVEWAQGATVVDVDGNIYIDFVGSWGPMILGHAHPGVEAALMAAARRGVSFGASHAAESTLAEAIYERMPHVEMVRLVSSGTEATMSAVRLARGVTGRDRIVKFTGCYHGHADAFLIEAGSGAATLGIPTSPGVPVDTARHTLTAPYNDLDAVTRLFEAAATDIAAIIVEPVAGNMGCIPPVDGFLEGLRSLCDAAGAMLIFDEVITGFRVARGGAQERYGVTADLTTLGKILGGGMPMGAFGGRRDLMEQLAPSGPVYQAGTLSGNPVAVACGLATLNALDEPGVYDRLERSGARMASILNGSAQAAGIDIAVAQVGSMLGFCLTSGPVRHYDDVASSDIARFRRLFAALLAQGVSIAPSAYESLFVSCAHTDDLLDRAEEAFGAAFAAVRSDP